MRKRRVMALAATAVMVATVGAGATLAYFTDKDTATNTFNMGHVSGIIEETDKTDNTPKAVKELKFNKIVPNQTLEKDPYVTLDSDSEDAYLRIKVNYIPLTEQETKQSLVEQEIKNVVFNFDDADKKLWYYNSSDGYFYYKNILTQDDETTPKKENVAQFFKSVTIPASWGNEMADESFKLSLDAELIQASSFSPEKDDAGNITSWGSSVNVKSYK